MPRPPQDTPQSDDPTKTDLSSPKEENVETALERLSQEIDKKKQAFSPPEMQHNKKDYSLALRLSSEFIAAILVGLTLGIGIDWLLGTHPFGLIILILFGFVAGILNMKRAME